MNIHFHSEYVATAKPMTLMTWAGSLGKLMSIQQFLIS